VPFGLGHDPEQFTPISRPPKVQQRTVRACITLAALLLMGHVHAEPFIGQFELKTLESAPGYFEFQSQNAWAWDQPPRRVDNGPADELIFDENALFKARYALEIEMGFTDFLKMRLGIEAENERVDEPVSPARADEFEGLSVNEIGAEIVAVFIRPEDEGFGLGAVVEIEGPFDQEEPNHLTIGPIMEYETGEWLIAAVPMFVRAFGGDKEEREPRDEKWDFAYAAQIMRSLSDRWSIALEGYGTLERFGNSGNASTAADYFGDSNQHRLGPVVYFSHALQGGDARISATQLGQQAEENTTLTIGLGLLQGLNSETADHTLKLSVEVDF
jgi:hypothetical protein